MRAYLRGIDLFNFGYWWESHEAWEGLWRACGRRGPAADFLKGLIKLAAAGVKASTGTARRCPLARPSGRGAVARHSSNPLLRSESAGVSHGGRVDHDSRLAGAGPLPPPPQVRVARELTHAPPPA
jgi:hypothetical protein